MAMLIRGSNILLQKMSKEETESRKLVANTDSLDFMYLKGRILTCDEPNANGDYFEESEVRASYETFIGGIVDYNHDTNILLGRIIDAVFIEGKEDEHASVDIICKINKKAYPEHTSNIEAGILCQMSLEAFADEAECSICGHNFNFIERQPCEHITGGLMRKIMGDDGQEKLVFKKDKKLTFSGAGIVPNPADKKADIYNVIAKANGKVEEGKIDEAKELVEEIKGEDTLKAALKKLNGLEFVSILQAIQNKMSGKTKNVAIEIAASIDEPITEKEFYTILSNKYGKLTTVEIEDIKAQLRNDKKLLGNEYNAYLVTSGEAEPYWVISKNNHPKIHATISQIWGEELNKDNKIDGMPLKEYAMSNLFKKRLLSAIETEGLDYVVETWNIPQEEVKTENVFDTLKTLAKELGIEIESSEIIEALLLNNDIQASTTHFLKGKFDECVNSNKDNGEISIKSGQTKNDAVETYCFNSIMSGSKITASKKENNIWATLYRILIDKEEHSKINAWLDYKISGKWYKNIEVSKKIKAKMFVKESMGKLNNHNDNKDYLTHLDFSQEFINKYGVYASKKDIDRLLNVGFEKKDIENLFEIRMGI